MGMVSSWNERFTRSAVLLGVLLLGGCAGGGGSSSPWWISAGEGTDVPADDSDASRFLHQATFGPTTEELEGLNYAGFESWFERQLELPPSLHRPRLSAMAAGGLDVYQSHRQEEWWRIAVQGQDQLRQRMAFALSQVLVVSDRSGALSNQAVGLAEYYDLLVRGSLGNFRDLLEDVTKSPAMGLYLSHLRNQKGDPANNIRPDENFARELMQLFTVGLIELNADGTPRLDLSNEEIPTYTQTDIEELSRVMTGWTYAGSANFSWGTRNMLEPMEAWPEYHDDGTKTLLGGIVLPAGLTPEEDLDAALDALFAHPNVGPFLSLRLIQRLVTSNPSPAYVGRVAAVFADDGEGVRGNLAAMAEAILMDDEARTGHESLPNTFGKVREPLIRLAGIWRAFDARAATGKFRYNNPERDFGQAALRSPSVFNFYYPGYEAPGAIANAGMVAPELQITTHTFITTTANEFRQRILQSYPGYSGTNEHTLTLQLYEELELAEDPSALVDHLDLLLMGGQMSSDMRAALISHVENTAIDAGGKADGMQRVLDAMYLIVTSPEGGVQM